MKAELLRRVSLADQLETLLKSRAGEWISITELAQVGGVGGWRTRLSELSTRAVNPLHIEWNKKSGAASAHRYLTYTPIGREAADFLPGDPLHGTLFPDLHPGPYQEQR